MNRLVWMLGCVLATGCGSVAVDGTPGGNGPGGGACAAGSTQICDCLVDGLVTEGVQTCMGNGQAWNPCQCTVGGGGGTPCGDGTCDDTETPEICPEDCGSGTECVANCDEKACGGDGCGGICGECTEDEECRPVNDDGAGCFPKGAGPGAPPPDCGDGVLLPPVEKCECADESLSCSAEEGSQYDEIITGSGSRTWCSDVPNQAFSSGTLWCNGCLLNMTECE
jgi:hypothetical protein